MLVKDLLISVTDFFRDPEAWRELQRLVIEPLVGRKKQHEMIRVWNAGCATGEEPYSVGMMILESLHNAGKSCPLRIFASDIDKDALDFARQGLYSTSIAADVPAERLSRFFTEVNADHQYRVSKVLREAIVFAEQDLIADPPFSRLDLICCRNLLIYLKPHIQEKVIAMLHFALSEGGVLMLGSAETVGQHSDLFKSVSKEWRMFRRIGPVRHNHVQIPIAAGTRSHLELRLEAPLSLSSMSHLHQLAQQHLIDLVGPSAVVVDRQSQILFISGDVDRFLTYPTGVPSGDLLAHARKGLRTALRVAVHQSLRENRTVTTNARVQMEGRLYPVQLVVRPIHDEANDRDLALVVFTEAKSLDAAASSGSLGTRADAQSGSIGGRRRSTHSASTIVPPFVSSKTSCW